MILLPLAVAGADEEAAFPERHVFELEGYSIEYSDGDEELARAVLERLVPELQKDAPKLRQQIAERFGPLSSLQTLAADRDVYLTGISHFLAFESATEVMRERYDEIAEEAYSINAEVRGVATVWSDPRLFVLWRKMELVARIEAGNAPPTFWLEGGEPTYRYPSSDTEPMPLIVGEENIPLWSGPAGELTRRFMARRKALVRNFQHMEGSLLDLHTALYEVVEASVVHDLALDQTDYWFLDGVANYVAYRVLEDRLGVQEARQFYDLEKELDFHRSVEDRIEHYESDPAMDAADAADANTILNDPKLPFATEVIVKACAKHGDDLLPKLFWEIQRTPPEERNIDTVYRAYRNLTREDLRDYFPKRRG